MPEKYTYMEMLTINGKCVLHGEYKVEGIYSDAKILCGTKEILDKRFHTIKKSGGIYAIIKCPLCNSIDEVKIGGTNK